MRNPSRIEPLSHSPRPGWRGFLDRLTGPGATQAELAIQFVPPLLASLAALAYAELIDRAWSNLQLLLLAILAFDLLGGVLTNATSSAKRWFHRPGQGWRQQLAFVSIHLIHVGLVAVMFRAADGWFFAVVSGYLLAATAVILATPLYLQRPVALGLFSLAVIGDTYLFSPTAGLEWFLPLFFLKLLVSHLVYEAPLLPGEVKAGSLTREGTQARRPACLR